MFINFSNHPSALWSDKQRQTAKQLGGTVTDYPFPEVSAAATEQEIAIIADRIVNEILELQPNYVMAQGEFTLSYAVIWRLKERGIPVLAACSKRKVMETVEDGKSEKTTVFEFVQFREYE